MSEFTTAVLSAEASTAITQAVDALVALGPIKHPKLSVRDSMLRYIGYYLRAHNPNLLGEGAHELALADLDKFTEQCTLIEQFASKYRGSDAAAERIRGLIDFRMDEMGRMMIDMTVTEPGEEHERRIEAWNEALSQDFSTEQRPSAPPVWAGMGVPIDEREGTGEFLRRWIDSS